MKKAWRKLYHKELICDFIAHGVLILLGCGFLLFHIKTGVSKSASFYGSVRLSELFITVIFAGIILSAISLYKVSASYIQWYKGILESIPLPVIATDKKANWLQLNKAAREILNQESDSELDKLNSKHLIDENGDVMKKTATHQGIEYQIVGNRLQCGGKDTGFLIILNNANHPNPCETRIGLISEINRLLGRLGTATDQFQDCASNLAGCTARQAGIINDLTGVITGIVSGEIKEPDTLNEKMHAVKMDLEQNAESNQVNIQAVMQTVKELDDARNYIGNAINNIDSVS